MITWQVICLHWSSKEYCHCFFIDENIRVTFGLVTILVRFRMSVRPCWLDVMYWCIGTRCTSTRCISYFLTKQSQTCSPHDPQCPKCSTHDRQCLKCSPHDPRCLKCSSNPQCLKCSPHDPQCLKCSSDPQGLKCSSDTQGLKCSSDPQCLKYSSDPQWLKCSSKACFLYFKAKQRKFPDPQ